LVLVAPEPIAVPKPAPAEPVRQAAPPAAPRNNATPPKNNAPKTTASKATASKATASKTTAPKTSAPKPGAPKTTPEFSQAETLRQCRAAGYHASQCMRRGCVATQYGLACRG
jgi:hypothetical protein